MTAVDVLDRSHSLVALDDAILVARQSGLYRVSANGAAQNLYADWMPNQDVPTLALAILPDGTLLGGINGGVARSDDNGGRWEAIQFRSPPPLVTCLAASTENGGDCILAGSFEDGIFRSADGGRSWRAHNHGLFDHGVYCLGLSPDFGRDGVVYAGVDSGLYKSLNGGRLWEDMTLPADDASVLSLALSPAFADDGTLYIGTESHGLLRSEDRGETWETALATERAVNALALGQAGTVLAQIEDSVWRSTDGENWTIWIAKDVECLALDARGESLLLGMTDGLIRREGL